MNVPLQAADGQGDQLEQIHQGDAPPAEDDGAAVGDELDEPPELRGRTVVAISDAEDSVSIQASPDVGETDAQFSREASQPSNPNGDRVGDLSQHPIYQQCSTTQNNHEYQSMMQDFPNDQSMNMNMTNMHPGPPQVQQYAFPAGMVPSQQISVNGNMPTASEAQMDFPQNSFPGSPSGMHPHAAGTFSHFQPPTFGMPAHPTGGLSVPYSPPTPPSASSTAAQQSYAYYEACMRDHAMAYATAAAGAAFAAAQLAASAADYVATGQGPPPPVLQQQQQQHGTIPFAQVPLATASYPSSSNMSLAPAWHPPPAIPYYAPPSLYNPLCGPVQGRALDESPTVTKSMGSTATSSDTRIQRNSTLNRKDRTTAFATRESTRSTRYGKSSAKEASTVQQLRPSAVNVPHEHQSQLQPQRSHHRRRRRRHWLASSATGGEDSSSSCCSETNTKRRAWNPHHHHRRQQQHHQHQQQHSNSSSSGYHSKHYHHGNRAFSRQKKHSHVPSDDILVGKTAVSALYIWCDRRQRTPVWELQPSHLKSSWYDGVKEDQGRNAGDGPESTPEQQLSLREAAREGTLASSNSLASLDADDFEFVVYLSTDDDGSDDDDDSDDNDANSSGKSNQNEEALGGGQLEDQLVRKKCAQDGAKAEDATDVAASSIDQDLKGSRGNKSNAKAKSRIRVERGRGSGHTKVAAKQEAARHALQALMPGVCFDEATGILVSLPLTTHDSAEVNDTALQLGHNEEKSTGVNGNMEGALVKAAPGLNSSKRSARSESVASLDDLAPHLAKRLAIGREAAEDTGSLTALQSLKTTSSTMAASVMECEGSKKRRSLPATSIVRRSWNAFPGTSTTSEEEQQNAYYTSKGASICSTLLYAIIQIDSRLQGPPTYEFSPAPSATTSGWSASTHTKPATAGNAETSSERRNLSGSFRSIADTHRYRTPTKRKATNQRGAFLCRAELTVISQSAGETSISPTEADSCETDVTKRKGPEDRAGKGGDGLGNESSSRLLNPDPEHIPVELGNSFESLDQTDPDLSTQVFKAEAVGGNKREARHVANARLLALLFPECETMIEVKQAAEAARDAYAASKTMKPSRTKSHDSILASSTTRKKTKTGKDEVLSPLSRLMQRTLAAPSDLRHVPIQVQANLRRLVFRGNESDRAAEKEAQSNEPSSEPDSTSVSPPKDSSSPRQLSRQHQIASLIESALQSFNDHDEEGRSRPEELTENDVGRTILRRAETEDLERTKKLLASSIPCGSLLQSGSSTFLPSSGTADDGGTCRLSSNSSRSRDLPLETSSSQCNSNQTLRTRPHQDDDQILEDLVTSPYTTTLLLCRAVAAFEDPPLGCAVVCLGFSMENGRTLSVCQMASEQHLPKERFLECLEKFAAGIGFALDVPLAVSTPKAQASSPNSLDTNDGWIQFDRAHVLAILDSHLNGVNSTKAATSNPRTRQQLKSRSVFGATSGSSSAVKTKTLLQSVKEEESSEHSDGSTATSAALSSDKRHADRPGNPSKRSRFQ